MFVASISLYLDPRWIHTFLVTCTSPRAPSDNMRIREHKSDIVNTESPTRFSTYSSQHYHFIHTHICSHSQLLSIFLCQLLIMIICLLTRRGPHRKMVSIWDSRGKQSVIWMNAHHWENFLVMIWLKYFTFSHTLKSNLFWIWLQPPTSTQKCINRF